MGASYPSPGMSGGGNSHTHNYSIPLPFIRYVQINGQFYTCMHTIKMIGEVMWTRSGQAGGYQMLSDHLKTHIFNNDAYALIQYQGKAHIVYNTARPNGSCCYQIIMINDYHIIECNVQEKQLKQQEDTIEIQKKQLKQQEDTIEMQEKQLKQQEDTIEMQEKHLMQNKTQLKHLKVLYYEQKNQIKQQKVQLAEKDRIIVARTNLNKRLIDTLTIYIHKQPDGPIYDYQEIKSRKQSLHHEFKRWAKLMKLG